MSEYTPTTADVRGAASRGVGGDGFDRWIAEHDRQVAEAAWDDCREATYDLLSNDYVDALLMTKNPYRKAEADA